MDVSNVLQNARPLHERIVEVPACYRLVYSSNFPNATAVEYNVSRDIDQSFNNMACMDINQLISGMMMPNAHFLTGGRLAVT